MIRNYFRTLHGADENLGRILKALDDLHLADNTIVIFTTDNGYYLGDHGLGDKRSAYEEALRIPLIVRHPRLGNAGEVCNAIALNLDLAPTLLDFAGVPIPPEMQGRSWRPLLEHPAEPPKDWRTSFFYEYFYERGFAGTPTITAVRTTEAKLVKYPGHPEWSELFELVGDPIETRNLFNDAGYTELRKQMEEEFEQQSKAVGYRVPTWADDPTKPEAPRARVVRAGVGGEAVPAAPLNGWVLDYRFDTDRDGKVTDVSGHNNVGSLHGELPLMDGREGRKARRFEGKSYIEVLKSPSLNPAGGPFAVELTFKADKPGAMLLARGGKSNGYCLYLDATGKPGFIVNAANRASMVVSPQPVGDGWVTLTARLTADKQLVLLLNGQAVAHATARAFIPSDPNDNMQIGDDSGSPVAADQKLSAFTGQIERVRIFSGDLPEGR